MSSLPVVTGKEAIPAFSKPGFSVARIRGSHHVMKKEGHRYQLSVPVHSGRPLKKGILRSLIQTAGITPEQFAELLD